MLPSIRTLMLAVILLVVSAPAAEAQWTQPTQGTGPIYYMAGNVGIGTPSPSVALDLKGNSLMHFSSPSALYGTIDWGPNNRFLLFGEWDHGLSLGSHHNFGMMNFDAAGQYIGIGTLTPANLLHIYDPRGGYGTRVGALDIESTPGGYAAGIQFRSVYTGTSTLATMGGITAEGESAWNTTVAYQDAGMRFFTTFHGVEGERVRIAATGNVGIGTGLPTSKLHVVGDIRFGSAGADLRVFSDVAPQSIGGTTYQQVNTISPVLLPSSGSTTRTALYLKNATATGQGTNAIDLQVDGDIHVSGKINSKFQDVAEWVDASGEPAAGTVVVLDPRRENAVISSAHSYDTAVAGVVSADPGIPRVSRPGKSADCDDRSSSSPRRRDEAPHRHRRSSGHGRKARDRDGLRADGDRRPKAAPAGHGAGQGASAASCRRGRDPRSSEPSVTDDRHAQILLHSRHDPRTIAVRREAPIRR